MNLKAEAFLILLDHAHARHPGGGYHTPSRLLMDKRKPTDGYDNLTEDLDGLARIDRTFDGTFAHITTAGREYVANLSDEVKHAALKRIVDEVGYYVAGISPEPPDWK